MSWTFDWHFNWPGPQTEGLEQEWEAAWRRSGTSHVFHQPALSRIWAETVAQHLDEQLVLLVARKELRKAYLPFTIRRNTAKRLWRRELHALGGNLVFDYQDPFIDGPPLHLDEWMEFWSELYTNSKCLSIDHVQLSHIPENAVCSKGGGSEHRGVELSVVTVAPFIDLRGVNELEDILMRTSSNHRSKMRRKLRAISSHAPRLKVYSKNDVADALQMFDEMLVQYERQHGGEGKAHMFVNKFNVNFYRKIIEEGLRSDWLHVSVLEVDGKSISWHIGFLWNRRFYWYKPCYGVDEEKLLPGHLHIAHLLIQGLSEGWEYFDFTVGGERYKFSWATSAPSIYRLTWYTANIRGYLYALAHKSHNLLPSFQGGRTNSSQHF